MLQQQQQQNIKVTTLNNIETGTTHTHTKFKQPINHLLIITLQHIYSLTLLK